VSTISGTERVVESPGPLLDRLTGVIGARVSGIDIDAPLPGDTGQWLVQALHTYGVLVLRADLDDAAQKRLARVFGDQFHQVPHTPMTDPDVLVLATDRAPGSGWVPGERLHTDCSFEVRPPSVSVLRIVTRPEVGGDTIWASMYGAYDALSSKYQRFLEGVDALHSSMGSSGLRRSMAGADDITAVHPVVIEDPVTRRRALYVNSHYTQSLVGFREWESEAILHMLFEHCAAPEFQMRLCWEPDTVVIWHEWTTQHRVVTDFVGRREVRRVTVCAGPPPAACPTRS
jgi:taurine dioxygenase